MMFFAEPWWEDERQRTGRNGSRSWLGQRRAHQLSRYTATLWYLKLALQSPGECHTQKSWLTILSNQYFSLRRTLSVNHLYACHVRMKPSLHSPSVPSILFPWGHDCTFFYLSSYNTRLANASCTKKLGDRGLWKMTLCTPAFPSSQNYDPAQPPPI